VPDIYQGCEVWNFRLVDPDNREPVDFDSRRRMLADLQARGAPSSVLASELMAAFGDGRIKLHVLRTGLASRRRNANLFHDGSYDPVGADEHVVAFERHLGASRLVCVVPRLSRGLTEHGGWPVGDAWGARTIGLHRDGTFVNTFTGESIAGRELPLARVFQSFPVAWLMEGCVGS
jgi:(1->4)-alpha-D-glucan 1-alpha-D-glucosylmutase